MHLNCSLIAKPLRNWCEVEIEKPHLRNTAVWGLEHCPLLGSLPESPREKLHISLCDTQGCLLLSFILHHRDSREHLNKITDQKTAFISTEYIPHYSRVIKTSFPSQKHNSS